MPLTKQTVRAAPTLRMSSLPSNPPKGFVWYHDKETREWKLVSKEEDSTIDTQVVASSNKDIKAKPELIIPTHLEHVVSSSDTFEGLCVRYRLTPSELRKTNRFSGNNMSLAPTYPLLIIPNNRKLTAEAKQKLFDEPPRTKEQLVSDLQHAIRRLVLGDNHNNKAVHTKKGNEDDDESKKLLLLLSRAEAKAYMDLNDWNLGQAILDAEQAILEERKLEVPDADDVDDDDDEEQEGVDEEKEDDEDLAKVELELSGRADKSP